MKAGTGRNVSILAVTLILSACGGGGGGGGGTVSPSGSPEVFTTWRTDLTGKTFTLNGEGEQVSYAYTCTTNDCKEGYISGRDTTSKGTNASATFMFDQNASLAGLILTPDTSMPATAVGFAHHADPLDPNKIRVLVQDSDFVTAQSTTSQAVISNPKSMAWEYQSFGVWETGLDTTTGDYGTISVGVTSPAAAIPGAYGSTFTGKIVGSYVNPQGLGYTVLATLTVDFDASGQSLTFNTTIPEMSSNWSSFAPNPALKLTDQTLTYVSGNTFAGTLTTDSGLTGGTSGQFYGPNAEELGGTFFLQSGVIESYSGAYGATR